MIARATPQVPNDHAPVGRGVFGDRPRRHLERVPEDPHARPLVPLALLLLALEHVDRPQQREPAPGHDPLRDGGPRGADRVGERLLPALELGLGGRAHADDRHAPGEFRQPLLELLAVVVALRLGDLTTDLLAPRVNRGLVAPAADDRRRVAVHHDPAGRTEVGGLHAVERHAEIGGDELASGEDRHVLHQFLAAVAVARRLHGHAVEDAP